MILWCKRKHFYTVPQFFFACGAIYIIFLLRKKIELAMSLDTLAFCSQKMQRDQSCNFFAVFKNYLPLHQPLLLEDVWVLLFVERTVQEKGLDFRFLLSRKIDPPLRSVAVREARAKRATTACCGGKIFFLGVFFAKMNPPHFENSAFFVEDLESPAQNDFFFFFEKIG